MSHIARLLLLGVLVTSCGVGGYWTLKHDLHQILQVMWSDLVFFVKTFDITVVIRAAMLWFQKMGWHWLIVEVPKRLIVISLLPYLILIVLPPRTRRRFRLWIQKRKDALIVKRGRFMAWMKAEHMFGPYAGWAIGLVLALVFFLFFYSAFWFYVALWLGFVKIPAIVTATLSYFWGKILFLAQKIPFSSLVFKWTNAVWIWLARYFPALDTFMPKTEVEKRKKSRLRARMYIRRRYRVRLFLKVGPWGYRRHMRVIAEEHKQEREKEDAGMV
jgi:hypothetical protein